MKIVKIGIRIWIAFTSLVAFLAGWALLSHAPKPASIFPSSVSAQAGDLAPLPTLAPVPSIDQLIQQSQGGQGTGLQSLPSLPQAQSQQFLPRLRTRGS